MPRPFKRRRIRFEPEVMYFKPRAVPLSELKEVSLDMDELEAIRLSDFEEISQTEASKKMNISQSTFQRILKRGRRKIAEAVIKGKALRIKNVLK